ncbi:hypothetical protein QSH39_021615 [Xanthomonas arboricola pv. corylina]|nr:hypothetical protein [Xanthomonas arboricola]MDN0205457.1 hypothetical protein [Xanthomonas arboricola pv. corylina]MDN0218391.1 hypothetical protein [Xanthomonas arboricola pv. corylina]
MKASSKILVVLVTVGVAILAYKRLGGIPSGHSSELNPASVGARTQDKPHGSAKYITDVQNQEASTTQRIAASDFSENKICFDLLESVKTIRKKMDVCNRVLSLSDEHHEQNKKCVADNAKYGFALEAAEKEIKSCQSSENDIVSRYAMSVEIAARTGNTDAQMCYIKGEYNLDSQLEQLTDEQISEYRKIASKYLADALSRGDWRAVQLLSRERQSDVSGLLPMIAQADPITAFKMNRLLRRGAVGSYARDLDIFADGNYLANGETGKGVLTMAQVVEADRWAQETYKSNFSNSPPLTEAPSVCENGGHFFIDRSSSTASY